MNEYYNKAKAEIKSELNEKVIEYNLQKGGKFTLAGGGEFVCPVCGRTVKTYRNSKGNWTINNLGHCADFGDGAFSSDTFGLVAAAEGIDEREAFHSLMVEKGIIFSHDYNGKKTVNASALNDTVRRQLDEQAREREKRNRVEEERRNAVKASNAEHLMYNTSFGFDMSDNAIDLLYKRGIDIVTLPAGVANNIGYIKTSGFACLDKNGSYSVEGIVFRLNEKAGQVRRTSGESYIGKESKMARFQTFGPATPYLMDYVLKLDKALPLFICEGPFDALSLYHAGAKASIAALGAGNHHYILEQFKDWTGPVFVCFDTDATGKACGVELVNAFRKQGNKAFVLKLAGQEHDINDNLNANPVGLAKRVDMINTLTALKMFDRLDTAVKTISSADFTKTDKHIDNTISELKIEMTLKHIMEAR